jgi:hypothetical protein
MEKKKFDVKFKKTLNFYLQGAQAWDICTIIFTEQSHLNS